MLKRSFLDEIGRLGAYKIARWWSAHSPRILVYHRFGPLGLDVDLFDWQMRELHAGFEVVPLSRLTQALAQGNSLPPQTVAITVDDGYADFYRYAYPVLKRHGLPATMYVVSDFVDQKIWLWPDKVRFILAGTRQTEFAFDLGHGAQIYQLADPTDRHRAWNDIADHCLTLPERDKQDYLGRLATSLGVTMPERPTPQYAALTWDEVREMQVHGIEFGSHTCTHPKLTKLDLTELDRELQLSKTRIEAMIDTPVDSFCYPNGSRADFNIQVQERVRLAGYRNATVGFHDSHLVDDLYALRRYGVGSNLIHYRKVLYGVEAARWRAKEQGLRGLWPRPTG